MVLYNVNVCTYQQEYITMVPLKTVDLNDLHQFYGARKQNKA